MAILVHLHKNERVTITELCKVGINQRTAYSALSNLQRNQLVSPSNGDGFPKRKYYRLTEKGRKVAKHLVEMERLLN